MRERNDVQSLTEWKGVEFHFLSSETKFEESNRTVAQRWNDILQWVPEMRGHSLFEDLTPILALGMDATGLRLRSLYDLSVLHNRFWWTIYETGAVPLHIWYYRSSGAHVWQWHLGMRYYHTTRRALRADTRIRKARQRDDLSATWLN